LDLPGMRLHPFKYPLASVPLGLLALQGAGQVGGLIAQALIGLLPALQFLAQRETLASFLLITVLDAFFERLNALLEGIEQLAQPLLAGLGETLLAFGEDIAGQLGKLRTQLVARALQILQTLLMSLLLLVQLRRQGRTLGTQPAQFAFLVFAFGEPGLLVGTGALLVQRQQFALATLGCQFGLLRGIVLGQFSEFLTALVQLAAEHVLSQQGGVGALLENCRFSAQPRQLALLLPRQAEQGQRGQQQAG